MTAVQDWFTTLPQNRGRMVGLAVTIVYLGYTFSQAQDFGEHNAGLPVA